MSKTIEDLKAAFAGESQANRKYLAYAAQADKDGFPQVAKLFRAAAEAETIHAHAHLRLMGGLRSTKENLEDAIAGETHEFTKMYPAMIEDAQAEGHAQALRYFTFANAVEEVHANLYKKALAAMDKLPATSYHVCSVCGYTCEDHAPDKCPVCQAGAKAFFEVK